MLSSLISKYLSLVAVFTHSLGLLNTAGHWQTMQIPYSCSVLEKHNYSVYWSVDPETGKVINTSWTGEVKLSILR